MLSKQLSSLTKPELEHTLEELNLTDEQIIIFRMLSKRKSIQEIAIDRQMSTRTVDREVQKIKLKMEKLNERHI